MVKPTNRTANIIAGIGIKNTPRVLQGLKRIPEKIIAETAPEAPKLLYE
jgi:hypothetical protein